jgi:hypothetical protein
VQEKCLNEPTASYPGSGLSCNEVGAHRRLDRLLAEASAREVARCRRASASGDSDLGRPARLGLEAGQSALARLLVDSVLTQVVTDQRVAPTSVREELGPGKGEALVVEITGATENPERLCPLAFDETGATQALVQPALRQLAGPQGSRRGRERAMPPELPAQQAEDGPLKREPAREPSPHDDLLRECPPASAVDFHRHAPLPGRA